MYLLGLKHLSFITHWSHWATPGSPPGLQSNRFCGENCRPLPKRKDPTQTPQVMQCFTWRTQNDPSPQPWISKNTTYRTAYFIYCIQLYGIVHVSDNAQIEAKWLFRPPSGNKWGGPMDAPGHFMVRKEPKRMFTQRIFQSEKKWINTEWNLWWKSKAMPSKLCRRLSLCSGGYRHRFGHGIRQNPT